VPCILIPRYKLQRLRPAVPGRPTVAEVVSYAGTEPAGRSAPGFFSQVEENRRPLEPVCASWANACRCWPTCTRRRRIACTRPRSRKLGQRQSVAISSLAWGPWSERCSVRTCSSATNCCSAPGASARPAPCRSCLRCWRAAKPRCRLWSPSCASSCTPSSACSNTSNPSTAAGCSLHPPEWPLRPGLPPRTHEQKESSSTPPQRKKTH
jgi:hypothetical protein